MTNYDMLKKKLADITSTDEYFAVLEKYDRAQINSSECVVCLHCYNPERECKKCRDKFDSAEYKGDF